MKKKIICLLTLFCLFLALFSISPIVLQAEEETPVISSNSALDTSSNQLFDGKGYFKKIENSTQYYFYYTEYLGTAVDFAADENLYLKKINRSSTPKDWYNSEYGLDLDNFESVSIINGKWSLPHEYVRDEKGVIIPESTGYLEESIYSDCRRYVYYLVYVNEDGVQRPKYNMHYECNVEVSKIPSYLLNDGKNEKMGIQEGKIYNTSLISYQAVKKIEYYTSTSIFVTEYWDFVNTDKVAGELKQKYEWYPIIYFNLIDVDYDYVLSVKYSYTYAEFTKGFLGIGKGKEKEGTRKTVIDEVFNDRQMDFIFSTDTPLFVTDTFSDLLLNPKIKDYKAILKNKELYGTQYISYITKGVYTFDDAVFLDSDGKSVSGTKTYYNRIVGHSFSNEYDKSFQILKENNSVSFLHFSYVYDGVIYASDDNVPIIGENQTPDNVTTQEILDKFFNDIIESISKIPAKIVDTATDTFWESLGLFFSNLSTKSIITLSLVAVILLLLFTSSYWIEGLRALIFRKNQRAYDASLKRSNRKAYQNQHRLERKELKQDRRYDQGIFVRDRIAKYHDDKHYSDRVDIKYQHEEYLQSLKNQSFEKQRQHEVYLAEHESKEKARWRRFWNQKNNKKNVKKEPSWFKNYMDEEKKKMKKTSSSSSDGDSLESLNEFFNKKK